MVPSLDDIVSLARSDWGKTLQHSTFSAMTPSIAQPLASAGGMSARTILAATAHLYKPRTYLEIGTRRGHSLCLVLAAHPGLAEATCVDPWYPNYGGEANPGETLVREEAAKFSTGVNLRVLGEPSASALPKLAGATFDLIMVDGDHSVGGALQDLNTCAHLLPPGGIMLFDDLSHPAHTLGVAWDAWAAKHPWEMLTGPEAMGWAMARKPT